MDAKDAKVTIPALQQMKRDGRKIVGVVSVGDTVGVNLWGQSNPLEVTMDQMILVCQAVRRGVQRALVSCDFPYGPLQEGTGSAVARAGIPVFAQLGITPQTALRYGVEYGAMSRPGAEVPVELTGDLIAEAKRLEEAGACLLDFTNSGPIVGPEVTRAVSIPVLGGFGGGPWLDGRMRMAHAAIGYAASALDDPPDTYANVAKIAFEAIAGYADDVRAGRQIKR